MNPCLSSPEGLALFALAKFLASPMDHIAKGQFLASPFAFLAGKDPAVFHFAALESIAAGGVAGSFADWVRKAARKSMVDATKVEAFIEAAADYDAQRKTGEDLRNFVEFVAHRVQQESETPGVVHVMTVHFSKGLGMDMVILPELGGKGIAELRETSGVAVHRNAKGEIEWGMALPSKEICAADPTLAAAREHLRARQAYESLCVLYVAMSRAKHALYCLHVRGANYKNPGRWLESNFPVPDGGDPDNRVFGNPRWFEAYTLKELKLPVIKGTGIRQADATRRAGSPSSHEGEDLPAGLILGGGAARHLGTEVHELLAQVEWLGDQPDLGKASPQAAALVAEFLASERAAILKKPGGDFILWRERAFDVEIDGRPLSGIFDRAHIKLGQDGRPTEVHIYDFKTDIDTSNLEVKYSGQMKSYSAAAALLLRISPDEVTAKPVAVRGAPIFPSGLPASSRVRAAFSNPSATLTP